MTATYVCKFGCGYQFEYTSTRFDQETTPIWGVTGTKCPKCQKAIAVMVKNERKLA